MGRDFSSSCARFLHADFGNVEGISACKYRKKLGDSRGIRVLECVESIVLGWSTLVLEAILSLYCANESGMPRKPCGRSWIDIADTIFLFHHYGSWLD